MNEFPSGFCIVWDGQEYRPAGSRSYTKQDGSPSLLFDWDTECPRCEAAFRASTGAKFTSPRRFCDACKQQGRTVRNMRKSMRREIQGALS